MRIQIVLRRTVLLLLAGLLTLIGATNPRLLLAQDEPVLPPTTDAAALPLAWPGEYIVAWGPASDDVAATSAVAVAQAQLAQSGELIDQVTVCGSGARLQVWRLDDPDAGATLQALVGRYGIQAVEPNWVVRAAQLPTPPPLEPEQPFTFNDTFYGARQWPLQRSDFARAWQLVAENALATQPVRVAVIDSGVDFSHPDLAGRLLPGVNYLAPGTPPDDENGHGTHVTGIIAAVANNGIGIAGGARDVEIDTFKVLNEAGGGELTNVLAAICDAADRGADVINLSLQVGPDSISFNTIQQMQAAVDYAHSRGAVLVAAAGNQGVGNLSGLVAYPARLIHVIAVAATTIDNTHASYSGRGTQLDLAAGGGSFTENVLSTWPQRAIGKCVGLGRLLLEEAGAYYCTEPGTSMSAPLVSAAVAMLLAVQPTLSADAVETILEETARDIGLPSIEAGAGLLDMAAAVRRLLPADARLTPTTVGAVVRPGAESFTQTVVIENPSLTPVSVTGVVSPTNWLEVVNLEQSTFAAALRYGEPLYLTFAISPTQLVTGAYASEVTLELASPGAPSRSEALPINLGIGNLTLPFYLPLVSASTDQPAPPLRPSLPFTWETPVNPTPLALSDSGWVTVSLPFAFPLNGADASAAGYTTAYVYGDGFIAFADGGLSPVPSPGVNQCLPQLAAPAQGVFGWWADLDPAQPGGSVFTFQPAADRVVFQYEAVASAIDVTPAYTVTFQIVLYANGDVGLNYRDVPEVAAQSLQELTPEVTIGIQARNGLFRNQVTCILLTDGFGRPPHREESILIKRGEVY